jgi:mRNA interferase RelE/StbE
VRYTVALKPAAQRELERLRGIAFIAVRGVILDLADEPRPPGSSKLAGRQGLWRVRVRIDGKPWRIVYQIDDRQRMIVVARVARRDEGTYRGI